MKITFPRFKSGKVIYKGCHKMESDIEDCHQSYKLWYWPSDATYQKPVISIKYSENWAEKQNCAFVPLSCINACKCGYYKRGK